MARTVTLLELRTQARELADMEETGAEAFVSDTELTGYANAYLAEWHSRLVKATPEVFETTETITATGAASYALPADHYKTLLVESELSNNQRYALKRLLPHERNKWRIGQNSSALGYFRSGDSLVLFPNPSSGDYIHTYAKAYTKLSADTDTVDGVNGWEQWISFSMAIRMRLKEDVDASQLLGERARIEAEIDSFSKDRELANPKRIQDTRERTAQWHPNARDFLVPPFGG